jgi:hypothetical protein
VERICDLVPSDLYTHAQHLYRDALEPTCDALSRAMVDAAWPKDAETK